jgi:hypothetical protein
MRFGLNIHVVGFIGNQHDFVLTEVLEGEAFSFSVVRVGVQF